MARTTSGKRRLDKTPVRHGKFPFRGLRAKIIGMAGVLTLLLPGCGSEPQKPEIPQFPTYKPTAKFLARQDKVKEWAQEIEEKREKEVVLNIIKGRNKFYRAWKPIYDRIEDHKRNPNQPKK